MKRNDGLVLREGTRESYKKQISEKIMESEEYDSDVQIMEVMDNDDEKENSDVHIIEVMDIDDEGDSEGDGEGECEEDGKGDFNDQLREDCDNAYETNELVMRLGLSREKFLKEWRKISKTAHESIEWRTKHSDPCTACNRTPCEFANSGTLSCIKCLKGKKTCSIRTGFISEKMAQMHGHESKQWIDRAVAHNWHKVRRTRIKKYAGAARPGPMEKVHKQMSGFKQAAKFSSSMETPCSAAKLSKSAQDRWWTVPNEMHTSRNTTGVQKLENQPRKTEERQDERAIRYKECQTLKEYTRNLQQELDKEHKKHMEIKRYKGKQETANDDVLHKKVKGGPGYELDKSNLLSTSKTNNATETESELETLRTKQDMWNKEKDRLKVKIRTVESALEDKQKELEKMKPLAKEAESKRHRAEKDIENIKRKMEDAKKATEEARRKLDDAIFCQSGDTSEASVTNNSGVIADTGLPSTMHRDRSRLQVHFLSGVDSREQTDLHRSQSEGVKSLEKEDEISRACLDIVNDQMAVFEKVKKLPLKGRNIGASRSDPMDSSTAWWRGAALFNQFQINLMERERFRLSSGLGSYLERLKSLRDRAKNSVWSDSLLRHELDIITESLISLHSNEQLSDIQQARNRLLFPHKHYHESDAEALERQIRRYEEIRHKTRDSEASQNFSWIDLQWLNLHENTLRKRARQDVSDTDDLPIAKRHLGLTRGRTEG